MKRIFTTYAMCRSGYHAVTYWIFAHFHDSVYVNDLLLSKKPLTNEFVYDLENPPSGFDFSKYLEQKSNVFTGFPDNSLFRSFLIDTGDYEETRIVVIRDPFNLVASRVHHSNLWTFRKSPHKAMPIWKEHAREFLGKTNTIKTKKVVFVLYNEWFRSYSYRQSITNLLQGDKVPGQSILEYISAWGFGSSFDFRDYQGKAFQMKVLERWKSLNKKEHKVYLFSFDEETISLSREIFGAKFIDPIVTQLELT